MEKQIIIVDQEDQPIEHKTRDQIVSGKDIYRVSVLWITNKQGEVLLSQRSLTDSRDPGKWHPAVAGTVEKGETYLTNILKKAREELGLDNIDPAIGPKIEIKGKHHFFAQIFTWQTEKLAQEFAINREEINEVAWLDRLKLIDNLQMEPNKYVKALPRIVDCLTDF